MKNRLFRTNGIVLKSIKLNESDKIITIFSQDYGKIQAIAKGIRKTKSQFGSSLENLTLLKILVYKGKTLNIVSQTEIISSFFSRCKDLKRYGLAIYCTEIIDKMSAEEDPNEAIYELLKNVLVLLKDEKNPFLLVESFKWKLFVILGYHPVLERCVKCNQRLKKEEYYIFDIVEGGIICPACKGENSGYQVKISNYCLRLLGRIIVADLQMIHNKNILQSGLDELFKITDNYMSYHFETRNRSKEFLNKLESME
ncbi:MAG: DNA repair protein RecO [Atribacterota bacterium]